MYNGPNLVTNGLVMYLDAGNTKSYSGSGLTWSDLSINKNIGTLTNSPAFRGGVINFDGTNTYVSRKYNSSFNIRTGLTLTAVIRRTSVFSQLSDTFIMSRPPAWYFYDSYNSGYIRGEVFIDTVRQGVAQIPVPYDGLWYMMTYTYDSGTGWSIMYKNGASASSTRLTGLSNYLIDSSSVNFINFFSYTNVAGRSFDASILQIYNRSLSGTEVLQNYNALKSRYNLT